jgi:hypothetical protein
MQPAGQHFQFRNKFARLLHIKRNAEQILELAGKDNDGDPGGESHCHRIGNEFDVGAEPQQTRGDQKHSSRRGCEDHPLDALAFGGQRHQHNKRAGGSADLKPAATQQ